MKRFIKACFVETGKEKIDSDKIDAFVDAFNHSIKNGYENGDGSFSMNTSLSNIPHLNESELKLAIHLAEKQGWTLTSSPDEHDTTTYKMKKI